MTVPAYRLTSEDLPDADKKTARAISPLLEALNRCLTSVIATLNALQQPATKATAFTCDAAGSAYVDLKLGMTPTDLWVSGLTQLVVAGAPSDAINFLWNSSWIPRPGGARMLFIGLGPGLTYSLRVRFV